MSKIIIGIGLLFIAALVVTIAGCSKTTTVLLDNSPAITETVQFSKTIVPILTKSCATSGCHSGSVAPNLTETNAYNSLVSGHYLNLSDPPSSEVYLWLTGKKGAAMPLGSANNPSNINALILAWIKQGAKNN
ncbi:hypothetical protein FW778_03340 [Ginsengibacter hankyongi]|uniref:Cytochrome C Planctomycete-type domain-containing protein n=1 Tax=Ginsengibacter hankyongi TaxID=2607284 RepID=A0A5J5IKJ7_9BACT|nr:hypothetical protein [Ginsengibacter hankyongi]KAA9041088.1 hypothetical protein FW778_03340 [Ginsengibacter hankyongi]